MWPYLQFPAGLVAFTEEIRNGKLHFLCSVVLPNKVRAFDINKDRKLKYNLNKDRKLKYNLNLRQEIASKSSLHYLSIKYHCKSLN